jgi:hypothetical protein
LTMLQLVNVIEETRGSYPRTASIRNYILMYYAAEAHRRGLGEYLQTGGRRYGVSPAAPKRLGRTHHFALHSVRCLLEHAGQEAISVVRDDEALGSARSQTSISTGRSASSASRAKASACRERSSDGMGESEMREIRMSGLTAVKRLSEVDFTQYAGWREASWADNIPAPPLSILLIGMILCSCFAGWAAFSP